MANCNQKDFVTIIKGEERTIPISFTKPDGTPYPLNAPDEITVKFRKQDKTILSKTLTGGHVAIVSDALGTATVILQETETLLLAEGERIDFAADITKGTVTRKAFFKSALTVLKDFA